MEEKKTKILIVDDEPYILRVLKMKLENAGYQVATATNGLEALQKFDQAQPMVLITDIHMPFMTGKELCQMIQERKKKNPFLTIVITSGIGRENRAWTEGLDNTHFVEKPFSPRNILKLINHYCREHQNA